MVPAYNKKRCAAVPFEMGIHFRRKTDFFPEEDTTKSYSGFEPEPIWLQAKGHSHHTGWATKGTNAQKIGSGATRKTTRREDRRIVSLALVDPTVTRSTMRADVGVAIVLQTISRHLAEANLKSKRPFRALPLTSEHRQLRLQWCQARSM
ncbi:HTH_Tnp_Tc3_2 domain-containing protein [Trichonephila clavipes]|nr:HTH_Tnp_Tc3_2 domain-containing protein [Trichonephila clavipes]